MPSFNQQQLNYKVQNSNGLAIMLGDMEIGFAQTTTLTNDMGAEALYGIGSAKPQEIQQLKFSPSLTVDYFELTSEGLNILGYPSTIGAVLANNSFNFIVMDGAGIPIYTYVGCTAQNTNQNLPANQPVTSSISFLAMDILDPLGVSILNSNSVLQGAFAVASALNLAGI